MPTTIRGVQWVDVAGRTRLTTLRADASLAAIQAALLAKSRAVVNYYWEGTLTTVGGAPSASTYASVVDQANLIFQDASCEQVRIVLPAPAASIFMADGQTVDPAQIAAITAAALGHLETVGGGVATAYIAGYRTRGNVPP